MARPYRLPGIGQQSVPAILQDITQSLQMAWTPHVFIELNDEVPAYVTQAWDQLSPIVRTAQFLDLARQIEAYTVSEVQASYRPGYGPGALQQLGLTLGEAAEIRTALMALLFGWSQTLLTTEALRLALDGQLVGRQGAVTWPRETTTWNRAIIPITDTASAGEVVRNVLAEARQSLGLPEPPEALLALGSWPRYLRMAWDDLKAMAQSSTFAALRGQIIEQAQQRCARLPGQLDLSESKLRQQNFNAVQIQRVREILDRWVLRLATELILSACFREALEENSATSVA